MKTKVTVFLMLLNCGAALAQNLTMQVTVTNDWKEDKVNEPVTVKLPEPKKVGFEVKSEK